MSKQLPIIIVLLFVSLVAMGQQMPTWSSYYETGFIWNPALTAKWSNIETAITSRKEWSGFENSPNYGNLSIQYPIVRRQTRISLGGYVDYDQVGPYRHGKIAATFAYKLRPLLFGNRRDALSLGLNANFNSYRYNPSSLTAYDGFSEDPELQNISFSSYAPNVGVGIFYMSVSDISEQKSHYYFGLSANQLIPSQLSLTARNGISNVLHGTVNVGYRHFPYRSSYYVEPNLLVTYSMDKAVHVMANVRYEFVNRFWFSLGAVNNAEVFGQVGFIFNEDSILGGLVDDGSIRLGAKVDYSYGEIGRYSGVGYEFYLAYIISNEDY